MIFGWKPWDACFWDVHDDDDGFGDGDDDGFDGDFDGGVRMMLGFWGSDDEEEHDDDGFDDAFVLFYWVCDGIMELIMILLLCAVSWGEDDGDADVMCGEALMEEKMKEKMRGVFWCVGEERENDMGVGVCWWGFYYFILFYFILFYFWLGKGWVGLSLFGLSGLELVWVAIFWPNLFIFHHFFHLFVFFWQRKQTK